MHTRENPRHLFVRTLPSSSKRRLIRRGTLAVIDQCLFTGTNFVTAVIVGRFAGPAEFGSYALAFSVVMLMLAFQRAFFMSSYVVLQSQLSTRLLAKLRFSILIGSALSGLVAFIVVLIAYQLSGAAILSVLAVAIPCAFMRDFVRRMALAEMQIGVALRVDSIIGISQLIGIFWLATFHRESFTASMALSWSALVWFICGAAALYVTRKRFTPTRILTPYWIRLAGIGGWISVGQVLSTVQSFIVPWIVGVGYSIELAGIYAACWSLLQLVAPVNEGIGNLLGPTIAQHAAKQAWQPFIVSIRWAVAWFAAVMTALLLLAVMGGRLALQVFYGEEYASAHGILVILTISALLTTVGIPASKALIQLGGVRTNAAVMALGLATICLTSVPFLRIGGPVGAAWAMLVGAAVATLVRWVLYRIRMANVLSGQSDLVADRRLHLSSPGGRLDE